MARHIAHNISSHGAKEFCKVLHDFSVDGFDWSSKRKNILAELCTFCDQKYAKIIKFHSVPWLGLSEYLTRTLKLFPSLKSYFLSQSPDIKDGERKLSCLNRLIDLFSIPMLGGLLQFFLVQHRNA